MGVVVLVTDLVLIPLQDKHLFLPVQLLSLHEVVDYVVREVVDCTDIEFLDGIGQREDHLVLIPLLPLCKRHTHSVTRLEVLL